MAGLAVCEFAIDGVAVRVLNRSIRIMTARLLSSAAICALLSLPIQPAKAQYVYSLNGNNTITLLGYEGEPPLSGAVTLPSSVNGYTVTAIGDDAFGEDNITSVLIPSTVSSIGPEAFVDCVDLGSATIPDSVTTIGAQAFEGTAISSITIPPSVGSIGANAFDGCNSLANVYFLGNAPTADGSVFEDYLSANGYDPATVYYLNGATGFETNFYGLPTVSLVKLTPSGGAAFGVQNGQFSMLFVGPLNVTVVLEACTNLANPTWTPLQTNTLANGAFTFSEPVQTNVCGRYYRVTTP
jgi:BspA type Leucine rich repeat region (6 copies)